MSRPSVVDPREAGIASDDEVSQTEEFEECAFCGQYPDDCPCQQDAPDPMPLRKRTRRLFEEDPDDVVDLTQESEEETEDTEEDPAPTPKDPRPINK